MSDSAGPEGRNAASAVIAFTIADLEMANSLMLTALATADPLQAMRTYNHAVRTLEETYAVLLRATPTAEQQARLDSAIALLEARLAAFRERRS